MLSESAAGLEELNTPFLEACSRLGLECNPTKTKMMLMSRRNVIQGTINIGDLEVESVSSFKYLGSTITSDNEMNTELKERIGTGSRCAYAFNSIMKSRNISRRTKVRVYNTVIRPTVLYGCETWTLTKERIRKLEVFENGILRRILGPTFNPETNQWERRHNEDIRRITGQPLLSDVVRVRHLRWAGHCARMNNQQLPKITMNGTVRGRRPVGRPRYRWIDNVRKDVQEVAPDLMNWQDAAQDRRLWRGVAKAVMGPRAREPHE